MNELTGSEALYGFIGWLTSNGEEYRIGPKEDCAVWPNLIEQFCETNDLPEPRAEWAENLTHPPPEQEVSDEREPGRSPLSQS